MKFFNRKLIALLFLVLAVSTWALVKPKTVKSAAFTSASITLSNSRLSYFAQTTGATAAGASLINVLSSGNADNNTNHLFPNDGVAIGVNGGKTVSRIANSSSFLLTSPVTVGVAAATNIYATQSGTVTVAFTIASQIPANGYIRLTIPDPAANGNDGAPDTGATVGVNGWDLNSVAAADVTVTGGTGCSWNATETITAGSGSSHFIDATTTTACTAGTITMTIGGTGLHNLINPAPITSGHTQGTADVYQWTITSYTAAPATGSIIDTSDVAVAPIEGVLVSATVDETLTFTVAGVTADSGTVGACGITRTASTPDTTAYSVPWGTIPVTYVAATNNTSQLLSVSTNAASGYAVTIIQNDQMGKEGKVCTGANAGESVNCIQDTTCQASPCSTSAATDWAVPGTYPGLGYSLQEVTSGEAAFTWGTGSQFLARRLPDAEVPVAAVSIMSHASPVNNSQVYVCYRLAIDATQSAGYYYNVIKYTATAVF